MMIKNQTIEKFLDSVASKTPTPGGGAVAAVTGAMAASLVEMVCNLTIGKKNYPKVQDEMIQIAERASDLSVKLLDLADRDSEAFEKVMEARKIGDKNKTKAALLTAIEIPEKTAEYSENVRELAEIVGKIGNTNAHSDAMSAEQLAFAAIQSAQENIEINKKTIQALANLGKSK